MKETAGQFNSGRRTLFYRSWLPAHAPKARLLLVHGLAEHSGRYEDFAAFLTGRGFAIYTMDLPSHGRSANPSSPYERAAFIDSFTEHEQAVWDLNSLSAAELPQVPGFILGHSMGGLITSKVIIQDQAASAPAFAGAILSAAALESPDRPGAIQLALIRILARWFPRLGVMKIAASGLSRDAAVVSDYQQDPLNYNGSINARCALELLNAMDYVASHEHGIATPMLVLHGSADAITLASGSQRLHANIASDDKTLVVYPGLYHEILNDPERQSVYEDIGNWLEQRCQ